MSLKKFISKHEKLKKLLYEIEDRKKRCLEIIEKHSYEKVILFGETIKDVTCIYNILVMKYGEDKVKLYHSELSKVQKDKVMEFINLNIPKIICVPTAFDEGVDIKDLNVGVIYQGKHNNIQQVQRLGRIIRKNNDKNGAVLYNLVCSKIGEPKFLDNFIQNQLETIESDEIREKINKRLKRSFIKEDDDIYNSKIIANIIGEIRNKL